MPLEIFSHDLSVSADDEAEGVFIISGKGWEGEPFKLYVRREEALNLVWQLGFFMDVHQ